MGSVVSHLYLLPPRVPRPYHSELQPKLRSDVPNNLPSLCSQGLGFGLTSSKASDLLLSLQFSNLDTDQMAEPANAENGLSGMDHESERTTGPSDYQFMPLVTAADDSIGGQMNSSTLSTNGQSIQDGVRCITSISSSSKRSKILAGSNNACTFSYTPLIEDKEKLLMIRFEQNNSAIITPHPFNIVFNGLFIAQFGGIFFGIS
ncbi:unnamed protein product [Protopolystoma xenopodis]|uniref:Uncharacterized protein n=1 Tax=Protopolystoma xenopodis TaxID=117903 RepID=A0A3S5B7M7_9PLAT|nr:unnamed protein product [Protopolystoma xenopodis]